MMMSAELSPTGFCAKCRQNIFVPFSDHILESPGCSHTGSREIVDPGASYREFLKSKIQIPQACGRMAAHVSDVLYPFQAALTRWAIRKGRAALFCDTGLGKTLMQVEWVRQSGEQVLIVAPLAVAEQTIKEAREKLGIKIVKVARPTADPIQITNYQKLQHFVGAPYDAIVLDESSILKSLDGKTRTLLLKEFSGIPRKLCCTATPAPNDIVELANHAEFLGVMPRVEMLATFFVHDSDGKAAGGWRLKGHAREQFWRWIATWAAYVRMPSDLGFEDGEFRLPKLNIRDEIVTADYLPEGRLFHDSIGGIQGRRKARKGTIQTRIDRAISLIGSSRDQWLVWCGLNEEADRLQRALGNISVNIEGADEEESKLAKEQAWRSGEKQILITKPTIFGYGMNWQHCNRMMFLGLGDSWEQYYQSIRRCWRFGQKNEVDVIVLTSDAEGAVADNVRKKEALADSLAQGILKHMRVAMNEEILASQTAQAVYAQEETETEKYKLMMGDCVERIVEVEDSSVDLSVFSPPFASLYVYSASERDMGNSKDYESFFQHFSFLAPELLRITRPGRRCLVHVQQVTTTKTTHGVIGWRDFRADVVRMFQKAEWVYDGEVVIDKDPQAQAIRTKSKALMFVQKNKDSSWLRPAMADYILCFRHPGENETPIKTDVSNEEWILWARPIWYGIRESGTLNAAEARSEKDERHIAPLQLETIERCVRLWSNPGETVFSPFAGIGSEGYVALQHDRRFIGIELKPEYYRQAVRNLAAANKQTGLFGETANA